MRWPDNLDIGVGLDGDRCISEIPRQITHHNISFLTFLNSILGKAQLFTRGTAHLSYDFITSNHRPFGCPIIYMYTNSRCYFVH